MSEATKEPDTKTLAAALVAAQAEMPAVKPDSTNPHFKSAFVSLGHLIAKVRPVLNKHGLAVTQFPVRDEDGTHALLTILMHKSGERLEFSAPLLLPKQDPQGQGSAVTYMRRYALASALGIADQEDDDGNEASKEAPAKPKAEPTNGKVKPGVVDQILAAIRSNEITWDEQKLMLAASGVNAPDEKPKTVAGAKAVYAGLSSEQADAALKFVTETK